MDGDHQKVSIQSKPLGKNNRLSDERSVVYTLARTTHTHTHNHTQGEQDLNPIRTGATRFVWGSFEVREMSKSKYSPRERESTVRDLQTVRHSGKDGKGEGTEWYHQNAKGNREKRRGQISITSGVKGERERQAPNTPTR